MPYIVRCDPAEARLCLTEDWKALLKGFPEPLRECSESLRRKLCFNRRNSEGWPGEFSELTLLYPVLQAEGLDSLSAEEVRSLALCHLLFLIHSVIEDRQLDGQTVLLPAEILFSKHVFATGLQRLRMIQGLRAPELDAWIDQVLRYYAEAQLTRLTGPHSPRTPMKLSGPASLAAGRASLGCLSVIGLGVMARCSSGRIAEMIEAFESLAIALQWADDADDWPGDFIENRDNLVLHELEFMGIALEGIPRSPRGLAVIGRHVLQRGLKLNALDNASAELRSALRIQRELNCLTLADSIEGLVEKMGAIADRWLNDLLDNLSREITTTGSITSRDENAAFPLAVD